MGEHGADEPSFRAIPDRVGRFHIERLLGSGGMASVYLAHEAGPGGFSRRVALKFLHPHLAGEPSVVAQFVREAKIAARIRHPNVVSVLEVGEHAGLVYLVMDFVDGESLASLTRKLGRKAIDLRVGLRVLCDALSGLEAAHALKSEDGTPLSIVHRDFSPHNLLIGRDGVTRLTDFGVAKIAAGTQHTQAGVVKGKVGYMSPEQARGKPIDQRTDVWAAGVVGWELATRQRLYAGKDDLARLFDVATRTPPRVRSLGADVPAELDEAIARALTRKPSQRSASAAELAERLRAACPGGLASHQEVASVIEAASLVSSSSASALVCEDDEPQPHGSLSASISDRDHRSPRLRWLGLSAAIVGLALAGAALFVLSSAGRSPAVEQRAFLVLGARAARVAPSASSPAPAPKSQQPPQRVRRAPATAKRAPSKPAAHTRPDAPLAEYPEH